MLKIILIILIFISNKMNSLKYLISKKNNAIYMTPDTKDSYKKVLFFMHGLGDSADSFVTLFQQFPVKETKVVLLNAENKPVTINGGASMPSWYDILDLHKRDESAISKKDVEESSKRIMTYVNDELPGVNNDFSKVFLGGFSQGGCMSLYTGLQSDYKFGGLIALSALFFPFTSYTKEVLNTPIFLAHGKFDFMIPYSVATESYKPLINSGISKVGDFTNVIFQSYEMEHTLMPEELSQMVEFVERY